MAAQLHELVTNVSSDIKNGCDQVKCKLSGLYTEGGCLELGEFASVVKCYSGTLIPLTNPKGYSMRVCGQDDTVYSGNEDQLEAWKDFFLPERMEMVVIGAIDEFPCDAFGLQLVLLLCEDGNIYAYEDEVLHLVARNIKELFETGLTFPGLERYNLGECFEEYTEEEYNEIMESDEMKEMTEAHNRFCEPLELQILESLRKIKQNQLKGVEEGCPKKNSDTTKQCLETNCYIMKNAPSNKKLLSVQ